MTVTRGGKFGPQPPCERRYKPRPPVLSAGPCPGCRHAARCLEGLACAALELFVNTGRTSACAPRQPSRDRYVRLYG